LIQDPSEIDRGDNLIAHSFELLMFPFSRIALISYHSSILESWSHVKRCSSRMNVRLTCGEKLSAGDHETLDKSSM
jgi:hypothetical protein